MYPLYDRSCENTKAKTEYSEEGTERLIFDEIHQQECWGELECCRELPLDFGIKSRRNLHLTTVSQLMVLHKSKIYCSEKYRKCICIYAFITLQWQKSLNGISISKFWKFLARRLSKCARVQKWASPWDKTWVLNDALAAKCSLFRAPNITNSLGGQWFLEASAKYRDHAGWRPWMARPLLA